MTRVPELAAFGQAQKPAPEVIQMTPDAYREPLVDDFDDFEPDDNSGCYRCGGRGYIVTCIDDLCHGQDECIHGDPPTPCPDCNRDGKREDAFF
jgi:hypothetical protein